MELLKIDWESYMKLWVLIFTCLSAATGFFILHWKWWLKKAWNKWYIHYRDNRNQWRTSLMDVQRVQINNQKVTDEKVDKLIYEFSQNGGKNTLGKIDRILNNQAVTKGTLDAMLYLDDTPTFKCDMEGNCNFVNAAWLQLLGFNDPQEAYGQGWYKTIDAPEKEVVRKEFEEAIRSETLFVREVNKINISNKSVIPVKMMTKIIRDEKNTPIEIVGQLKLK